MTVRELIELNQMITDVEIEIRKDGHRLLDVLCIGCAEGVKPPCPRKVPESEDYINNPTKLKEARYIPKSINVWDDGKDYWQVKPDRIPKAWLELTVFSWQVWEASSLGINPRRRSGTGRSTNVTFHGERLNVIALPPGIVTVETLAEKMTEGASGSDQIEGQMDINDFITE